MTAALLLTAVPAALVSVPGTGTAGVSAAPTRGVSFNSYRINPIQPVLYSYKTTRVTVRVWANGAQTVNVTAIGPSGGARKVIARKIGSNTGTDVWQMAMELNRNAPIGTWNLRMSGWDGNVGIGQRVIPMRVRGATNFGSFNAKPERVRIGRKLLLVGRLYRLDQRGVQTKLTVPYGGTKVKVYFSKQKPYPRTWKYVTSIKTRKNGKFWKKIKVRQDGTWRVAFPGNSTYAPSHGRDDYIGIRWT